MATDRLAQDLLNGARISILMMFTAHSKSELILYLTEMGPECFPAKGTEKGEQ